MSFKDEPSKRFFSFFDKKMKKGELEVKEIASRFGKYESNPGVLFRSLKTGKNGVTVELILKAQEFFGLNPCDLFKKMTSNSEESEELEAPASPELREYFDLIKSQQEVIKNQQQTIHQLVNQRDSKGGSM